MAYVICLYIILVKGCHLRCANCRHLHSFCSFHSLCALGRHRSEQVLQVRHRKLTSCLKRDQGIECWGYLISISIYGQYFWIYLRKQIHGAINRQEQTRLRLDQLGLSLLRGLHVCFVSFEGLTHAKQRKVADWKHQTPFNPNTKLPRAALVVAAWARPAPPAAPAHTCNHRPSPINDG